MRQRGIHFNLWISLFSVTVLIRFFWEWKEIVYVKCLAEWETKKPESPWQEAFSNRRSPKNLSALPAVQICSDSVDRTVQKNPHYCSLVSWYAMTAGWGFGFLPPNLWAAERGQPVTHREPTSDKPASELLGNNTPTYTKKCSVLSSLTSLGLKPTSTLAPTASGCPQSCWALGTT